MAAELARGRFSVIDGPRMRQAVTEIDNLLASLDRMARSVSDCVRVDVSNLYGHFSDDNTMTKAMSLDHIESALSPWPRVWLECAIPDMVVIRSDGRRDRAGARFGVLVSQFSGGEVEGEIDKMRREGEGDGIGDNPAWVPHADERYLEIMMWSWPGEAPNPQGPLTLCGVVLDGEGRVARDAEGVIKIYFHDLAAGHKTNVNAGDDDGYNRMCLFFGMYFPLMTLRFANCRNVELVEVQPNRQQRRAAERSGDRTVVHSVLAIKGSEKRRVYAASEGAALARRMHICRGHFATYTTEAPLFGRHVGRYWVPAHVRGNRGVGEVHKDYVAIG